MKNRFGLISTLTAILLFIILETFSILMVVKNGVVQRYRILGTVRDMQSFFWNKSRQINYYFNYKVENEKLIAENLQLRQQLSRYSTFLADYDFNSEVPDIDPNYSYIAASVIKNSVDKQHNFIVINKGRKDGVEPGMGVITGQGIIGIVNAVTNRYAYIISLLNTDQSVSAKLSNGAFGPMTWDGTSPEKAHLKEIPVHVEVAAGDTVVSSGFSTIYPPDVPIGTVTGAQVNQGTSQDLEVQLFEDFRSLHSVYVVTNNRAKELEELYEQVR